MRPTARCGAASAIALAGLVLAVGCASREHSGDAPRDTTAASREAAATAVPTPPDTLRAPHYERVAVGGARGLVRFQQGLGPERLAIVLKLNRLDLAHVRDRDSLIVPDSLSTLADLSPFPRELPSQRGRSKLLLVSLRAQAFAAYDSGGLARWGPASTGRESLQTPPGLYHTNWKDRERVSTFNEEWLLKWYVNLDNFLGISLHEYDLPGYPASHSCVRLQADDAEWLYGWAEQWVLDKDPRRIIRQGTPVVVFGEYAFHHRAPWKSLPEDSRATELPLGGIEDALRTYLPPDMSVVAGTDSLRRM